MGYYTHFDVNAVIGPMEQVAKLHEIADASDNPCNDLFNHLSVHAKWNWFEEDMQCLSASVPDVLIEIVGYGEDHPDIWKAYFKDGKMQMEIANITFAPFDESELK